MKFLTRLFFAALVGFGLASVRAQQGSFVPDGAYPTTSRELLPRGIRTLGSWVGGDQFEGRQESAWTPAESDRVLFIAGYPNGPGLSLEVQWRLADGSIASVWYKGQNPHETWQPWKVEAPAGARALRWIAEDRSRDIGGWLAVSEFVRPSPSLLYASVRVKALAAFAVVGLLLGLSLIEIGGWLGRDSTEGATPGVIPGDLRPLVAAAVVAQAGFVVLWIWFWSPRAGWWASSAFVGATAILGLRRACFSLRSAHKLAACASFALAAAAGVLYLLMLFRYPALDFHQAAAHRFLPDLPADNEIPQLFAEKLIRHEGLHNFLGDWLSSDRPPLQAGWELLYWPVLKLLRVDADTALSVAGCWFQLLWCPALWGLARSFGFSRRKALALVAAAIPIGLLLLNSVYVWPKLSAASLVMGAVTLGFLVEPLPPGGRPYVRRFVVVGGLMVLGWLSHGGAAFAILGAAPLFLWRARSWRAWAAAGLTFLVIAAPWLAYQRFYDPPGNRLLKWHLAGAIPVDSRGILETLVSQYRGVGWHGAWAARRANFAYQNAGSWSHLLQPGAASFRRTQEFFFYLRSAGFYLPAGVFAWLVIAVRRRRADLRYGRIFLCALWVLSTWVVWLALMFLPDSAVAHQGTYAIALGLYALLLAGMISELPLLSFTVIGVQSVYFLATWLPP